MKGIRLQHVIARRAKKYLPSSLDFGRHSTPAARTANRDEVHPEGEDAIETGRTSYWNEEDERVYAKPFSGSGMIEHVAKSREEKAPKPGY
ncbi:MAG: hypothetical protein ACJ8FY_12255 [Gemmataceae bacterium]